MGVRPPRSPFTVVHRYEVDKTGHGPSALSASDVNYTRQFEALQSENSKLSFQTQSLTNDLTSLSKERSALQDSLAKEQKKVAELTRVNNVRAINTDINLINNLNSQIDFLKSELETKTQEITTRDYSPVRAESLGPKIELPLTWQMWLFDQVPGFAAGIGIGAALCSLIR